MLQGKIGWKHDTGKIHMQINKPFEGLLRLKYKNGRALFILRVS